MTSSASVGMDKEHWLRVRTRALPLDEATEFTEVLPQRRREDSSVFDYSLLRARGGSSTLLPGEILSIVRVEVEDTGPGIPQEALGKIFDPFYSTKPPGEGTGLGLAICLRILESYGGRIHVQSKAGAGATFIVLLPILGVKHGAEKNIGH